MFLKKADSNSQRDDGDCSVLLSPLSTHTSEEMLTLLIQLSAEDIDEISPGFISAKVSKSVLPQLQAVAQVDVKHPYQMR
jgi:hypothetical protein